MVACSVGLWLLISGGFESTLVYLGLQRSCPSGCFGLRLVVMGDVQEVMVYFGGYGGLYYGRLSISHALLLGIDVSCFRLWLAILGDCH